MVVLESDSTEAIDIVLGVCAGNAEDRAVIQECREIISREWKIEIRHISREANKIADWIAKWAARRRVGTFELKNPPQELMELLIKDGREASLPWFDGEPL